MCIREYATQIPYGVVEVEEDRLRAITEKPTVTHLASAGIYALSGATLAHVPPGEYFDMPRLFEILIREGLPVRVHRIEDYWVDIGRVDDLEKARLEFGKKTP